MATTVARLEAVLTAHTDSFDRKMSESETRMHKVGKVAGIAGAAIVGGLAVGLEHSVKAAVSAQASQARLEQAFKNAHLAASVYTKRIDEAETASRKLGFTDEDTRDSLARLLTATHNYAGARKELTVAEDIARFKSVSLTDATKMLTMAQTGSQRAAKQLGITVPTVTSSYDALKSQVLAQQDALHKNSTAAEKASFAHAFLATASGKAEAAQAKMTDKLKTGQLVIEETRQHVLGQGKAFADTAAGGMAQFHAQLDHLQVSVGSGLLPILVSLTTKLADLMSWFARNTGVTKLLLVGLGALGVTLLAISAATKAYAAAQAIARAATVAWTAAQWLLNAALTANPIGVVIVALAALGVALVVAYKRVKFFRDGVNEAWSWIKDHWPLLVGIIGGPIGIAVEQIITRRNQIVSIFRNLPGDIADAFKAGAGLVKNAVVGLFHRVIGWVKSALGIASPSSVFYEIGKNSILGFVHGVGSMAGVLKNAVVGMVESLPGKVVGAVGGFAGSLGGHAQSALGLPGEHQPGSAERYLIPWAHQEGIGITSVATGNHVSGSYHYKHRAIDVAGAAAQMARFFYDSIQHFGIGNITELFYDPIGSYIKNGRVIKGAIGGHSDHVHIALDQGGWLPTGTNLITNNTGRPERVLGPGEGGGNTYNFHFPGYVGDESVVAAVVRDALESFQNRNGRPAYEGGF